MSQKPPTYCKDDVAIAKAIGLKLIAGQRQRRLKQLDLVRSLFTQPGFPLKQKHGWERAAVIAFAHRQLTLSKDCRSFEIVSPRETPNTKHQAPKKSQPPNTKVQSDLPVRENPKGVMDGESELFLTPEQMRKNRLDFLQELYFYPEKHERKIVSYEIEELKRERPELWGTAPGGYADAATDDIDGGVEGIAAAINKEFPGANCHAVYVSDWLKGKRYPCTKPGVPPMPPRHQSGRHKRSLVFPWYRQHVYAEIQRNEFNLPGSLDARARKEEADAVIAEIEAENARRERSGLYTLTATVEHTGSAIGVVAKNTVRDAVEKHLPKLFASGLESILPDEAMRGQVLNKLREDTIATFNDWQTKFTARLEGLIETNLTNSTADERR